MLTALFKKHHTSELGKEKPMSRRVLFVLLGFCLLLETTLQTTRAASKQINSKPSQTSSPTKSQGTTVDAVVEMVQAGLSEDLIVASLRKDAKVFDLSPADMIRLKKANVSDNIIKVMLDPK